MWCTEWKNPGTAYASVMEMLHFWGIAVVKLVEISTDHSCCLSRFLSLIGGTECCSGLSLITTLLWYIRDILVNKCLGSASAYLRTKEEASDTYRNVGNNSKAVS